MAREVATTAWASGSHGALLSGQAGCGRMRAHGSLQSGWHMYGLLLCCLCISTSRLFVMV